jgi:hypothetical protein
LIGVQGPTKAVDRLIGGDRRSSSGSLATFTAMRSALPDRIASVFLLLPLCGKQIDYCLSVRLLGHTL